MNKFSRYLVVDSFIYLVSLVLIIPVLASIRYTSIDPIVIISSYLIGTISIIGIVFTRTNLSVRRVIYLFSFFFFFVAPLQQRSRGVVLWSSTGLGVTYTDLDYARTNFIIILFLVLFEISYRVFGRITWMPNRFDKSLRIKDSSTGFNKKTKFCFLFLSFLGLFASFISGRLFSFQTPIDISYSNLLVQLLNIMRYLPLSVLVLTLLVRKEQGRLRISTVGSITWILSLINLLIFFPFSGTNSRFLLFGAYMIIATCLFSRSKMKAPIFLMFIVGFFYVFSAFNIFKVGATFAQFSLTSTDVFSSVDFDAYQMFMLTQHYVKIFGTVHGMNFLSALLCFLPRSLFSFRLQDTGFIVISAMGSTYQNVSNPLVSELYFAGGILGVLLGTPIIGALIATVDSWDFSRSMFKKMTFEVMVGMSIYVLRGSLLSTWSYVFSFIITVAIVSALRRKLVGTKSEYIGERFNEE